MRHSDHVLTFIVAALFTIGSAILLTSWQPLAFAPGNLGDISDDLAFMLAAPALLHAHAQWGPDVVFTYGPLQFLSTYAVYPEQALPFLVFRLLFAVTTALLLCATAWHFVRPGIGRTAAVALFACNAYVWFVGWFEAYWLAAAIAIGMLRLGSTRRLSPATIALIWVGTTLLGAGALVKFSLTAIYVGIFGLLAMRDLLQRRVPLLSIWFVCSIVCAWLLAGQHLANLPTWITTSLDLSGGYSAAMAKGFWTPYSATVVALTYLAAALLVAIPLRANLAQRERLLVGAMAFGIAAVSVQHSFGGNQIEQSVICLLIAASVLGVALPRRSKRAAALCILACTAILTLSNFSVRNFLSGPGLTRAHFDQAMMAFTGKYDLSLPRITESYARVRRLADLPPGISGTADVYPRKTAVVLAYPDLIYRPRPAFLSLNAHTEALARGNADFLRSARAPDWIVFDLTAAQRVNNRYPATDDGPSWPEIWARYDLAQRRDDLLLYHRKAAPEPVVFQPIRTAGVFGKPWPVDQGALVWAKIDVQMTVLGRLVGALYKAPLVLLDLTYEDGPTASYQIVPALGRAGFLLSPTIQSTLEFADRHGRPVKAATLRIEGDRGWFFQPRFEIEMSTLQIGASAD